MKNSFMQSKILRAMPVALLLLAGVEAFSQSTALPSDNAVIVMKDGKLIENAQLWQLHSHVLEYELNGDLHDVLIADVQRISTSAADYVFTESNLLEKASSENFSMTDSLQPLKETIPVPSTVTAKSQYEQGYHDADIYYNGTGAAIGGFASGMVPVLGWFVTMPIIGATQPQMYNADNPNVTKLQDKDYRAGYKKKATNKKIGNTLGGFGVGLVTLLLLVL